MITQDLHSHQSRPAPKSAGPPEATAAFKPRKHAKEFASLMEQALHAKAKAPRAHHADRRSDAMPKETLPASDESPAAAAAHPSAEAAAPSQNSNIILFPTPSVIIPFPVSIPPSDRAAGSAGGGTGAMANPGQDLDEIPAPVAMACGETSSLPAGDPRQTNGARDPMSGPDEEGLAVTKLGLKPVEDPPVPDNIKAVDFQQAQGTTAEPASSIVSVCFRSGLPADEDPSQMQGTSELTHLPGEVGNSENSAQPAPSDPSPPKVSGTRREARKAAASTALGFPLTRRVAAMEAAGITAARQSRSMDSMTNTKPGAVLAGDDEGAPEEFQFDPAKPWLDEGQASDFSARNLGATEWQMGRPVSSSDRPALQAASAASIDPMLTVERISGLLQRETALVRPHSSDAMSVVLRPDAATELVVHLAQRNGRIEATVRCERGDFEHLNALWPQLQHSLAQQKVRLAPLQDSPHLHFTHSGGSNLTGDGNNSRRPLLPDQPSLAERPAPASSSPAQERGRGGSRRRLTTSRPGWETWA